MEKILTDEGHFIGPDFITSKDEPAFISFHKTWGALSRGERRVAKKKILHELAVGQKKKLSHYKVDEGPAAQIAQYIIHTEAFAKHRTEVLQYLTEVIILSLKPVLTDIVAIVSFAVHERKLRAVLQRGSGARGGELVCHPGLPHLQQMYGF